MFSIENSDGILGLYLSKNSDAISPGIILFNLHGEVLSEPTQTSIKMDEGLHVEDRRGQYMNHSCKPTTMILNGQVVAIKKINPGDEITFDYTQNEERLVVPFICKCCGDYIS